MLLKMKHFVARCPSNQQHSKMVQELCKSCRFDISPNLKSNAKLYVNTLWIQPNPRRPITSPWFICTLPTSFFHQSKTFLASPGAHQCLVLVRTMLDHVTIMHVKFTKLLSYGLQLNIKLQATLETCIQSRHVAWQFQQCRYLQCICPIFFRDRKAPSGWQGRCVCFFHTSSSAPLFLHETRQTKKHKELWKISQETLCLSSQAETCQWAEEKLIVQGLWHQIFERLSCSRHCKKQHILKHKCWFSTRIPSNFT